MHKPCLLARLPALVASLFVTFLLVDTLADYGLPEDHHAPVLAQVGSTAKP